MPFVYQQLRRLAGSCLRNQTPGFNLQPTSLVHEAYIRLIDRSNADVRDRAHFLVSPLRSCAKSSLTMRGKSAAKRGGGSVKVEFQEGLHRSKKATDLVALDVALRALPSLLQKKS